MERRRTRCAFFFFFFFREGVLTGGIARSARHGGASRRIVERLAGLRPCARRHCRAAFEGERRWRAANVGANEPAVSWLLKCDVCTTKVLFRTVGHPIDCLLLKHGVLVVVTR